MEKLVFLLLVLGYVIFVEGKLTNVVSSSISFHQKTVHVGEQTYSKNAVNESIPLVIVFTWIPEGAKTLKPSTPLIWTCNNASLTVPKDTKTGDLYYEDDDGKTTRVFTLTVVKNVMNYVGEIALTLTLDDGLTESTTATVQTQPLITADEKPRRHLQGDHIQIRCPVQGFPYAEKVQWSRFPSNSSEGSLTFSDRINATTSDKSHTKDDILNIRNLEFDDDGYFRCQVTNSLGSDMHVVELRVKDRLAALWPFIGIVIEVIILVTAILLYEKRRSHNLLASREETKEGANGGYAQVATSPAGEGETDAETRQRAVKA